MAQREEILEEDRYRAQFYRLLSRLLARAPDRDLLTQLSQFDGNDTAIGQALDALGAAARTATPETTADEFQNLFIGIGRGELVPFASFYLTGFLNEKPLARLRQDMAIHGVERAEGVSEPEDHIASVCEIMAGFILGDFEAPMPLAQQSEFFDRHIGCWAGRFFEDLENAKSADFYKSVGALGRAFLEIETTAFHMAA
jgi:TorA maturation chaperone TorD